MECKDCENYSNQDRCPPVCEPDLERELTFSRILARQTLQTEIDSKTRHIDLLTRDNSMEAAARENAVREGLQWALFVLECKYGV